VCLPGTANLGVQHTFAEAGKPRFVFLASAYKDSLPSADCSVLQRHPRGL